MTADNAPALVHTDSRGRVYLGKHLQPDRDYRVTKTADGVVVFEPVTALTDAELEELKGKAS